jgi:hypothetical protein
MGEGSAKKIPYGIHGMGGGIHLFHMEDTGECKDLDQPLKNLWTQNL